VTLANGTLALVLALTGLKLTGEVIVPSFTFSATAHALHWAGLKPVFADIDPHNFTLDPQAVDAAITPQTSAILGVHVYGHPCNIEGLQTIARRHELTLLFDAAHAFGSGYDGQKIGGFGDAEIFSFHATKLLATGEGGAIATTHPQLATYLTMARNFGDPGQGNTQFCGLNAKMQEFNAIIGLENLRTIDEQIKNRRHYAHFLIEQLSQIPGLRFQRVSPRARVNYQNFAIIIDEAEFGLSRDQLHQALAAENISSRQYFYPPLHLHRAYAVYRETYRGRLPITEAVAGRVLCLPFYSVMSEDVLDGICLAVESIHRHAKQFK
jgi:dTDP-4-amino-4,6-dideoxygalactose transaminase